MAEVKTFESVAVQRPDGIMDLQQLFQDINTFLAEQRKTLGLPSDFRFGRTHPLQHVLNATSGGYVSPTGMKGFEQCPANYVLAKFFREESGTATSIGHTYHAIMESFYTLPGPEREYDRLVEIMKKQLKEDGNQKEEEYVRLHVDRYWDADDYIPDENGMLHPMDHKNLSCATEQFIKPENVAPLGIPLGVPVYLLVDRVDVRDNGLYVVDYKTGAGDPNPYIVQSYLPQMIYYKWGVEAEYGEEVREVFLSVPSKTKSLRYVRMKVNSLVEQSKVIESTLHHVEHANRCRESRMYEISNMRYCNGCPVKDSCMKYAEKYKIGRKLVETIPVKIDVEMKTYHEEE